jgi:hypothetical protein
VLVVATVFALTGCGQADEMAGMAPAESTRDVTEPEPEPKAEGPPDVVLASEAGRQVGVVGSYCVENPAEGYGACADGTRPAAKRANVVAPGETVTFLLDGARAVRAPGCRSRDHSCVGEAQVSPAGCRAATVARVGFERGSETRWRVNLEPGAYELQVFVNFEADDGRSGDVSVALGLLVDPDAEPAVVPMPASAAVCP